MASLSPTTILFFSTLRDIVGCESITLDLRSLQERTVAGLLSHLFQVYPDLEAWAPSLLIAVDQEYAARDQTLQNAREIAIMPPVQGG